MNKRSTVTMVAVLLAFLPTQAEGEIQAKAGAKCTKVNSTQSVNSKKFTCVRSGSKLIWNKGVKILTQNKSATPTLTPSVTTTKPEPSSSQAPAIDIKPNPFNLTPFPDAFTRVQMVEAVFLNFNNYIKQSKQVNSFKLLIETEQQGDTPAITKLVNDIYSVLPFPAGYPTTVVVIGQNKDLLESAIKQYSSFDRTGSSPNDWKICLNCGGLGWASPKTGLSAVTPHEIFHIWQRAAYKRINDNNPDPSNPANAPVWFDEGGADFFGEAMYSKTSNSYQSPKVFWQPYKLKDYATRNIDGSLPYLLGRLACEYIVASKGMDKFLDIYWNVGAGQNFSTAFENALGITLDTFYEKFDKNLQKML